MWLVWLLCMTIRMRVLINAWIYRTDTTNTSLNSWEEITFFFFHMCTIKKTAPIQYLLCYPSFLRFNTITKVFQSAQVFFILLPQLWPHKWYCVVHLSIHLTRSSESDISLVLSGNYFKFNANFNPLPVVWTQGWTGWLWPHITIILMNTISQKHTICWYWASADCHHVSHRTSFTEITHVNIVISPKTTFAFHEIPLKSSKT